MPSSADVSPIPFDYVLFIEWLREYDLRTGTLLHKGLTNQNIASQLRACSTAADVVGAIREAIVELPSRGIPIVQIDTHGSPPNPRNAGLLGKDHSEALGWENIWAELRKLNIASEFNLIVVAAACFGESGHWGVIDSIHSLDKGVQHVLPAPYAVSVGFSGKVSARSLANGLGAFYRSIFDEKNLPLAVHRANAFLSPEKGEELTFVWVGRVDELSRKALEEGEPKERLKARLRQDFPGTSDVELELMVTEVNQLTTSVGHEVLEMLKGKKGK